MTLYDTIQNRITRNSKHLYINILKIFFSGLFWW